MGGIGFPFPQATTIGSFFLESFVPSVGTRTVSLEHLSTELESVLRSNRVETPHPYIIWQTFKTLKVTFILPHPFKPLLLFYWLSSPVPHMTRTQKFCLPELALVCQSLLRRIQKKIKYSEVSWPVLSIRSRDFNQSPGQGGAPILWSQTSVIYGLYGGFIAFKNVSCLSPLNCILFWLLVAFRVYLSHLLFLYKLH